MSKILYTGLNLPNDPRMIHCPLIRIVPLEPPAELEEWLKKATHLVFTSQTAVHLLVELYPHACEGKICIGVGKKTASFLPEPLVPKEETAEGLLPLLYPLTPADFVLWPHSKLSRAIIPQFLEERKVPYAAPILYDTIPLHPETPPPLDAFDEIIFTSPSTVESFISLYGTLPTNKKLTSIGPVTDQVLLNFLSKSHTSA